MSTTSTTSAKEPSPSVLRRAIAASAIGNATEWFDYGVYGAATIYITNHITGGSIIVTLLGFAVSFVLRPLGGFIWGPLGDRIGRRAVLSMTIILMSGATFLLAFIPTYATIGVAAPIILVALRVIQGFSTGGEYGGAATFMAEYAPDKKRGFYGSFLEFGTLSGLAGGALLMLLLQVATPDSFMNSWGWRIPFMVAAPLGLVGLYLRTRLEDTPVFRELEEKGEKEEKASAALGEVIRNHWRTILVLMGLVVALNVVNYTLLSYMPTYLQDTIHLSANKALLLPIIGEVVMMIFIPFAGRLSDHIGRKPVWLISMVGLFVLAIPAYMLMGANFGLAILAFVVLGLLYILQLGTISATFPAMFPATVRYAGFAIGYNVSTALFGGTSSLVNEWMIGVTGSNIFPAYYMMGACAIGIIAWFFMKETAGASIRGTKVPEAARTATGKFIRPSAV
ncbi:MFS transporter [Microlunatus elymi]|uniref:Putative proline/betaine transporter n=1 Tax=Microlunatus elymi TaxID=2596828 RepID=A0A516Q194_9ACTN|nr:MFS transporter [Microlunatus elymi]QDP97186.1 MFS transporter [Microlunatus elymi]